jgi:plasmid replication initiation protein
MNLAEFPLTVLSKRVDPSVKTLEFSDSVKGKNGEVVNRAWIITGADKFGLPTSSDDEVLLGLLKLTADDGIRSRKIFFTRYELLKILRWTTEGRSYSRLQNALDRLSGVRIKATNAFYDNEMKLHSTKNFGIIDEYEINDGRDTRPSFFTWSEVLYKSFQVGFIKKLDLDFYLDLRSAVSKRLYRYLDKHFWYRSKIQVNLFTLAHEKIGISRNYLYASSLRQQLEPALEELAERGMLSHYEFVGKGQSTEMILVAAHGVRKESRERAVGEGTTAAEPTTTTSILPNEPRQSATELDPLVRELTQRGIAEKQAYRVLAGKSATELTRVRDILSHFDRLVETRSHLVSKNPCGFLYRAVERPLAFVLPADKRSQGQPYQATPAAQTSLNLQPQRSTPSHQDAQKSAASDAADRAALEARYHEERLQALLKIRASLPVTELTEVSAEAESALIKLKHLISPTRFREAVEHGIEQRLLDRRGFPDFYRWSRAQAGRSE